MMILVSGSHGLIGSALVPFLMTNGHRVVRLVRTTQGQPSNEPHIFWNPAASVLNTSEFPAPDAVVHLAGESIADGRWTQERKARIRDSRVTGTRGLCEALTRLPQPPRVIICASAIGYYGHRERQLLTESSQKGSGFLADLCEVWERAMEPAVRYGIRVVQLRIGVVLSPMGGALAKMLVPFRLGLGGPLGNGRQVMSWIAIDDAIRAIHHALVTERLQGPVNLVAPHAVTNREFARILGRVLARPAIMSVPACALRLLFGELANEALLASANVLPTKLSETGYSFRFPELEGALRHLLGD